MRKTGAKKVGALFLLDPLESLYGPLMPAFLLAKELREKLDITFISPIIAKNVAEILASYGFTALNLHKHFLFSGSLLTLEAWLRRTELESSNSHLLVVNFSQCFLVNAHIYYAQGSMTKAFDDMFAEMRQIYNLAYRLIRWLLTRRDRIFVKELEERSKLIVANSNFCASMYENWDVKVDDIIYPPLDCQQFRPTTSRPSGDYVLTYAGKETKYSVLRDVAEANVEVKVFGSKAPYIPSYIFKQPNIQFLSKVSDAELVDLYSNALYTLFVFTHEPFGYIPIESMACGTPVLTYGIQGPSESVLNGQTGWFAKNDRELVDVATKLWKEGHPQEMRENCRERALHFDVKMIAKKWLSLIEELIDDN